VSDAGVAAQVGVIQSAAGVNPEVAKHAPILWKRNRHAIGTDFPCALRTGEPSRSRCARARAGDVRWRPASQQSFPATLLRRTGVSMGMGMKAAKSGLWFSLVLFLALNDACVAQDSVQDYRDLKPISFFGSISVKSHIVDSTGPDKADGLSSEELTQFMRLQFSKYFPSVPFRGVDVSRWSDEENKASMGRFSCRVWIESNESPVAYQVKCQISTSDHLNIIEDASLGYGPKDKVPAIVRQQIDRMVQSFAVIYFRVRNEP